MLGWGREQSRGKKKGEADAGDGERVLGPLRLLLSLQGSSRHIPPVACRLDAPQGSLWMLPNTK